LWANWPKNSNMEVNSLAMSVNPLQWWADLFIVFHFIFFSIFSIFFLIKSWNVWANFFKLWSPTGTRTFSLFFLKTSVFETCNV
jgi:hypothetical protein